MRKYSILWTTMLLSAALGLNACTGAKESYYLKPISLGEQGVPPVGAVPGVAADAKQRFVWGPTVPVRQLQRVDSLVHETYEVQPRQVVCAEPSPDALSTFSSSVAAALRAEVPSQVSAGGEFSRSLSETARILGQRTPTIQLLRDGFYRACEAYGNGLIDSFGYALILNNIDKVMVRLLAIDALGQGQLKEGDVTKIKESAEAETEADEARAALQQAEQASVAARTRVENLRAQQSNLAGRIARLKAEETQANAVVGAATTAEEKLPEARTKSTALINSIRTKEAQKRAQDQIADDTNMPAADRQKAAKESQNLAGELAGLQFEMQTAEKNRRDIEEQVDRGGPAKTQAKQLAASLGPLGDQKVAIDTAIEPAVKVEGDAQNTATKARSDFASKQATAEGKRATLGTIRPELGSAAMSQIAQIVRDVDQDDVIASTVGACALWFAQHPSVKVLDGQDGQGFTFIPSDVPMIARYCANALHTALQITRQKAMHLQEMEEQKQRLLHQRPATVGQP